MDFDKEMEKKFDELFWYVLNEQTHQLNKEKEYMELNRTCQEITGTNSKIQSIIENNESVSLTKEEVELLVKYFTSCNVYYECICLECGKHKDYKMSLNDRRHIIKTNLSPMETFMSFYEVRKRYLELIKQNCTVEEIIDNLNSFYKKN